MVNLYREWENDIRTYCEENGLDFSKAQKMAKGWGDDFLILQYHDPSKGALGLNDETPMPVVLRVTLNGQQLVFEQTENTKKYLTT